MKRSPRYLLSSDVYKRQQLIWNNQLLDSLSLHFGENKIFFEGNYSGWPINNTLHKYRPILKFDDSYCCFNYYNFVDNFYRTIYKAIIKNDKQYTQKWQIKQKEITETYVANIFKRIFPDAIVLQDNYFFINGIKSNRSENDLIVSFDKSLFIIEVKAGNFTPDNPFVNFSSHKKSITDLIEKPDEQCTALLSYLEKHQEIYNESNDVKYLSLIHIWFIIKNEFYRQSTSILYYTEFGTLSKKCPEEKIMANYTKKVLSITLQELMKEKPLNDITVQELVDQASMNRKTFYYHFHTLSDLLLSLIHILMIAFSDFPSSPNVALVKMNLGLFLASAVSRLKSIEISIPLEP